MGKIVKINKATDRDLYTVEFDATTTEPLHPVPAWTNTGIVEIGMYYAPNDDWESVKLKQGKPEQHPSLPTDNNNIHIAIKADDFSDILLCGVNDQNQMAVMRFCRNIPVLSPTKVFQSKTMGSDRMFAQLHNDTDLVVGVAGREKAYFKELYWKHVK